MKLRLVVAFVIFVGSYLPLSLILLAQNFEFERLGQPLCLPWSASQESCTLPFENPGFSFGIFIVCLSCFAAALYLMSIVKPKREITIAEAKHVPAELMNYVLPYVVSFMSIDYQETGKFVGFLIFLGWMFWITYKSGQIVLNPLLTVFGWRMYDIAYVFPGDSAVHSGPSLSKYPISPGSRYRQFAIQDVLVLEPSSAGEGVA